MRHLGHADLKPWRCAAVVALLTLAGEAAAQCTNAPSGQWPAGTITPACTGTPTTITTCNFAGEYAVLQLTAGVSYTFCSSIATDFITIATPVPAALQWGTSCITFTPATTGTYRMYIHANAACATNTTCRTTTVQCGTPPPPVTNDNPCGAIVLPVPEFCFAQAFSNIGATATAGPPAPGCGGYTGGDVWFQFTAPASGAVYIESGAGSMTDGAMALYAAPSCAGPFTLIECDDDDGPGAMPYINRRCVLLTPFQTYFIRFWGFFGSTGTFTLCVYGPQVLSTPQEDCIGGFTICNSQSFSNNTNNTGCVADLNGSNAGCLLSNEVQGTWYAFSIANGGTLGLSIQPVGAVDYDWAVWGPYPPGSTLNTICQPVGAPIRCSFASGPSTFGATGSYATGFGHPVYSPPQFATPLPAWTQGAASNGWLPGLIVTTGQVYLLYIDNWSGSQTPFTLGWTLGGGASLDCTVLPVELVSLQAQAIGGQVRVEWATASESNSSHFVVEHALDGMTFHPVGTVEASGNCMELREYAFLHDTPTDGLNFYRLTQYDLDGSPGAMRTTWVEVGGAAARPWPNPATHEVMTMAGPSPDGILRWSLLDATGRQVRDGKAPHGDQRAPLWIGIEDLPAGSYTLVITSGEGLRLGSHPILKR